MDTAHESVDEIARLNEMLGSASTILIPRESVTKLKTLNEKLRNLLGEQIQLQMDLSSLLDHGKRIIDEQELDICPPV